MSSEEFQEAAVPPSNAAVGAMVYYHRPNTVVGRPTARSLPALKVAEINDPVQTLKDPRGRTYKKGRGKLTVLHVFGDPKRDAFETKVVEVPFDESSEPGGYSSSPVSFPTRTVPYVAPDAKPSAVPPVTNEQLAANIARLQEQWQRLEQSMKTVTTQPPLSHQPAVDPAVVEAIAAAVLAKITASQSETEAPKTSE